VLAVWGAGSARVGQGGSAPASGAILRRGRCRGSGGGGERSDAGERFDEVGRQGQQAGRCSVGRRARLSLPTSRTRRTARCCASATSTCSTSVTAGRSDGRSGPAFDSSDAARPPDCLAAVHGRDRGHVRERDDHRAAVHRDAEPALRDPPSRLRSKPARDRPARSCAYRRSAAARGRRADVAHRTAGLPRRGNRRAAPPGGPAGSAATPIALRALSDCRRVNAHRPS
jgi:hypothetical protein